MAKNLIYKYDEKKTRVRVLAASVDSGVPLLDPLDARPAVSLTASGDLTKTVDTTTVPLGGGVTSLTYKDGGASLIGKETTLAYDGVWEFAGVVSTGTTPVPTSTAGGVKVYITSGLALTLVSTSNTFYGTVDYPTDYYKRAGILPIRVGS